MDLLPGEGREGAGRPSVPEDLDSSSREMTALSGTPAAVPPSGLSRTPRSWGLGPPRLLEGEGPRTSPFPCLSPMPSPPLGLSTAVMGPQSDSLCLRDTWPRSRRFVPGLLGAGLSACVCVCVCIHVWGASCCPCCPPHSLSVPSVPCSVCPCPLCRSPASVPAEPASFTGLETPAS